MATTVQNSPNMTLREQAQAVVRRFNAIVMSHRRLMPDALAALERLETVTIQSGTPERPVIELRLHIANNIVISTVHVDPTLQPRMRDHAETLAQRFREQEETSMLHERKS